MICIDQKKRQHTRMFGVFLKANLEEIRLLERE